MELSTYKIFIEGTVQGVGFRPFIYQLALRYKLKGTVLNGTHGVEVVITSSETILKNFLQSIQNELPPLAYIEKIETKLVEFKDFEDFKIITTKESGEKTVRIPPDVSVCKECEKELFDPANRRYAYPFITCTNCGVRYSIIYDLPYDRVNTSMKFFEMCKRCKDEYSNPLDRRYHAQPIGCWECGPKLSLWHKDEELTLKSEELLNVASKLLLDGNILAVKGVGGYHLMCDATNEDVVAKLRKRKHRPSKPFAVMVKDIDMAKDMASISKEEELLLTSKERPIVVVKSKGAKLKDIAPNISYIGLFLPYTPLHLLLLHKLNRPLVATSANVTNEPICTDLNSLKKLDGVYDYILEHNRSIVNACDDSVLMVVKNKQIILRRARGYAPASVTLPFYLKQNTLALGANQKSSIAIAFENQVILSPHIGDLNSIDSVEYYEKSVKTLERMYDFNAEVIAYDMHPEYESSKYAKKFEGKCTLQKVQHHYAHILAVMAEKKINTKVFAVAFDGTGYGDDAKLWGGEFMLCDYESYKRVAQIDYFKLLGGAKAIKEPRRVALSLLFDLYGEDTLNLSNPTTKAFSKNELKTSYLMWKKGLNAPLSSSVGRLFDAVASLLDICQVMSFEGESGMRLEELYSSSVKGHYNFTYKNGKIDVLPFLHKMLKETNSVTAVSKFFHTLVEMIAVVYEPYDLPLLLSGGVFQNRILLELILNRFPNAVLPNLFPPNDGGIALGQIVASSTTCKRQ
jgi:hydrogenase maturation protein HypF